MSRISDLLHGIGQEQGYIHFVLNAFIIKKKKRKVKLVRSLTNDLNDL